MLSAVKLLIVGLDVRALGDREAHVGEDRDDLVDHLADRMDAAACQRPIADRQRHVGRLGRRAGLECRAAQLRACALERLGDAFFEPVDGRADALALVRRQRARASPSARRRGPSCRARRRARPRVAELVGSRGDGGEQIRARVAGIQERLDPVAHGGHPAAHAARVPDRAPGGGAGSKPFGVVPSGPSAPGLSTSALKAAGSLMAMSASTLRSISMPALFEAVDKSAVGQAVLAHRGVDALDPQGAERALARLAVAIGILQRLLDRLLGDADGVLAAAVDSPWPALGPSLLGVGGDAAFDACHVSDSFEA